MIKRCYQNNPVMISYDILNTFLNMYRSFGGCIAIKGERALEASDEGVNG